MRLKDFWTPKGRKIKTNTTPSRIPPRDWKYWCMVALSLAWFVLLTLLLWKSTYTPTVGQWWKDQARLERIRQEAASNSSSHSLKEKLSDLKAAFLKKSGYTKLNFDSLAGFPAETPNISAMQAGHPGKMPSISVPSTILSLDGQKVSVAGFMIPMTSEKDKVLSFILAQSRMTCCYGMVPKFNQWIYVTMDQDKSAQEWMDVPVTVFGTLNVGTKYDEENKGWCLYRMTGDKVDLPKKSWF